MANYKVVASPLRPVKMPKLGTALDYAPHRLCGAYSGTPPSGSTTTIECDERAIGRYVYVYAPIVGTLYISEFEIFGFRKFFTNTANVVS